MNKPIEINVTGIIAGCPLVVCKLSEKIKPDERTVKCITEKLEGILTDGQKIIVLADGVELTSLNDEQLKDAGLKRI